jgi:hypothetical protein
MHTAQVTLVDINNPKLPTAVTADSIDSDAVCVSDMCS